ncbi:hypothetical protein A3A74_07860 [Candidatus Roizmanbacteria bacterium RIFCSPLOWO2_01_FULL_35_13]|uniref:Uncharacterized protein n=1 Tax=Candidatus Roizmanbacteria bacterium RIFCSPLOWO2_01_FULL_35_13 TaxID=1802055 RepID=A0A1F7I987_9BACT|nr:MAG: hypothetical protein A3A74_07860 [Candidatus Roizmanbacteria bacterium RIFCSPLOWO2_01_FULL_35_13]
MKKKVNYCSLTPDFPKQAFVSLIFISDGKEIVKIYPLRTLFSSEFEVSQDLNNLTKRPEFKDSRLKIEDRTILIPIYFHSHFFLKKEFWKKPDYHLEEERRLDSFLKVHSNHQFYKILILPQEYKKKNWIFYVSLPFYLNTDLKTIENFMLGADEPVELRAKYAAFYTAGKPMRFDRITRKIDDPDNAIVAFN